ncbi:PAS domain-containing protein, partial [Hymenobacter agri]
MSTVSSDAGLPLLRPAADAQLQLRELQARVRTLEKQNAALTASEARFRKVFTNSHDALVLLQAGQYVDCNAAALRLLGATRREQLVDTTWWRHAPEFQPDGQRTREVLRANVAAAIVAGSKRCMVLMRRLSGEEIWVEAVLTPMETDAAEPLMHIRWRDVTSTREAARRLQASESRLNLALAASQTGVFTWDFATEQVEADATACMVFGLAVGTRPVPFARIQAGLHRHDLARVWGGLQAAIAVQESLDLEFRVVWPDASVHHLSLAGRVVAN